jgi:hypothetical protein
MDAMTLIAVLLVLDTVDAEAPSNSSVLRLRHVREGDRGRRHPSGRTA